MNTKTAKKATKKPFKAWTKQELDYFMTDLSNKEISEKTGRTKSSIENRRYMLRQKGIKVNSSPTKSKFKFWTPEELNLFKDGLGDTQIAKATGRNRISVSVKRAQIKKKGFEESLNSAQRINRGEKGEITVRKTIIPERTINKASKAKVIAENNLHFVVNGLNLYVSNACTNVYIRKDKVEVNF